MNFLVRAWRVFGQMMLILVSLGSVALFAWLARTGFELGIEGSMAFGFIMLGFSACFGGLAFETLRPERPSENLPQCLGGE